MAWPSVLSSTTSFLRWRKEGLLHHYNFFQAFDYEKLTKENRKRNYELAFQTGE